MSERISKERAIHNLKVMKTETEEHLKDLQALDIAIDSLDNEWVDVRDRLPQKKGLYLVTNFDLVSYTTWTTTSYFNNNAFELDGVIAWKPLPKPYERKE